MCLSWPTMKILRLQPSAQPGIVNLRLTPPEIRVQSTLNLQMVELQLDYVNMLGEIATDIGHPDQQTGDTSALGMCFDDHDDLLSNEGWIQSRSQV